MPPACEGAGLKQKPALPLTELSYGGQIGSLFHIPCLVCNPLFFSMTARGWCWTYYPFKDDELAIMKEKEPLDDVRLNMVIEEENLPKFNERTMCYQVFQLQRAPETGRIHWQGYTQFKVKQPKHRAIKYHAFKEKVAERAFSYQRATKAEDAKKYVTDDEKNTAIPVDMETGLGIGILTIERGEFDPEVTAEAKQGARTDLLEIKRRITEEKATLKEIRDEVPDTFTRYCKVITAWCAETAETKKRVLKEHKWMADPDTWKPAKKALAFLKEDKERAVLWLWSEKGAVGKTTLLKWLYDGLVHEGGQRVYFAKCERDDRLAYGYDCQPFVFIDCPREGKDIPYKFIEMCRDNHVTSGMYGVVNKIPDKPIHVIVCANYPPDYKCISDDIEVVNMDPEDHLVGRVVVL